MTEPADHTFYAVTARAASPRPTLTQDIETEVCVVGGGFAGLWAARALAQRGKEVVLLEAGKIAGGASGQNGGFVSAGYAAELPKIVARVGLDHARELYDLSRAGVEMVRGAIALDRRAMHAQPGRLHVLRKNDEVGLSDYAEMLSRDFGHELELWRKERVRAVLASDQYYQALHEPGAFHLHPLNLARLLAAEIEDRGGRIFEDSRVLEADVNGLRKSLVTTHGRVRAFNVVLAGSAAVGTAFPWLAETILPIRTHVAVTAPLGERLRQAIRYEGAIADTRRAGDYYHLAGDRLLWGGRISARSKPPRQLERLMGRDIARVYPQLKGVPIEYAWSGVMGYAVHLMPQIGMAQPGVWVSSAFGGHGLNTTAIAGELLASAIAEQDDRWRLFLPFGLVWNGGKAGRSIAQAVYWGMQAKDWLDEAQTRAAERDEAAINAGLAPGLAAHTARRAKRRFLESAVGRASVRVAGAVKRAVLAAAKPFIWTGRKLYQAATAVGRALIPVIWLVARVINFIARAVGKAMEAIAEGIVRASRWTAKTSGHVWRRYIAPAAEEAWRRGKARGQEALEGGRKISTAFGQWSAKQPGIVWNGALVPAAKKSAEQSRAWKQQLVEAYRKRAEQRRVAVAAALDAQKKAEPEAAASVAAEKTESEAATEKPAPAEETGKAAGVAGPADAEKQKKKKKKIKEKKDSVEA